MQKHFATEFYKPDFIACNFTNIPFTTDGISASAPRQYTVRKKNLSGRVYASPQTELFWRCFSKKKLSSKQSIYNFLTHSFLIKIWKTNNITEYNNMI